MLDLLRRLGTVRQTAPHDAINDSRDAIEIENRYSISSQQKLINKYVYNVFLFIDLYLTALPYQVEAAFPAKFVFPRQVPHSMELGQFYSYEYLCIYLLEQLTHIQFD